MTGLPDFAYAQARLQSRYGQRADEHVWLRLHNIIDLESYLQVAQQTALQPWVLGISANHNSHEIELALRQKYRYHVDEVTSWIPADWREPLQWIKRLADLPVLQYLLADGKVVDWMKSDPDLNAFTDADTGLRLQAMRAAGCGSLVYAWQHGDTMFSGWLLHWKKQQPQTPAFSRGMHNIEDFMHELLRLQTGQQQTRQLHAGRQNSQPPADYDYITDKLRVIFRRYAFQPAAVCAYLAIIALDIHHVRSSLLQRLLFQNSEEIAQGVPP